MFCGVLDSSGCSPRIMESSPFFLKSNPPPAPSPIVPPSSSSPPRRPKPLSPPPRFSFLRPHLSLLRRVLLCEPGSTRPKGSPRNFVGGGHEEIVAYEIPILPTPTSP